jgi:hypothetical protein
MYSQGAVGNGDRQFGMLAVLGLETPPDSVDFGSSARFPNVASLTEQPKPSRTKVAYKQAHAAVKIRRCGMRHVPHWRKID